MGLLNFFKKRSASKRFLRSIHNSHPSGEVSAVIDLLWSEETIKELVNRFRTAINNIITENNIQQKTMLLGIGLDLCLEFLENAKKNPKTTLVSSSMTAFIYFRTFLDCVLALDVGTIDIGEWYNAFRSTKPTNPDMHPFPKMMIKIYDLLDSGIMYLYKNMDSVTEDCFIPVTKKVRRLLDTYVDDNTDWNKIA